MAAKASKKRPTREPSCQPFGDILGVRQAAAFLGIGQRTVYAMAKAGEIPHFRLGKSLRFSRTALQEWAYGQAILGMERG